MARCVLRLVGMGYSTMGRSPTSGRALASVESRSHLFFIITPRRLRLHRISIKHSSSSDPSCTSSAADPDRSSADSIQKHCIFDMLPSDSSNFTLPPTDHEEAQYCLTSMPSSGGCPSLPHDPLPHRPAKKDHGPSPDHIKHEPPQPLLFPQTRLMLDRCRSTEGYAGRQEEGNHFLCPGRHRGIAVGVEEFRASRCQLLCSLHRAEHGDQPESDVGGGWK